MTGLCPVDAAGERGGDDVEAVVVHAKGQQGEVLSRARRVRVERN